MVNTPPQQADLVSLHEATERLELSTEAVRKRIQRGTLPGRKVGGAWYVEALSLPSLPSTGQPALSSAASGRQDQDVQPAGRRGERGRTGGEASEPVKLDLSPLVALVDRLHAENRQLTEAATAWQMRAMQAEERVRALEAGPIAAPPTTTDAQVQPPPEPEDSPPPTAVSLGVAWRRWFRRMMGQP